MKICLVGSGVVPIPPKKGGATELIVWEIAKSQAKKGNEVMIMDMRDKNKEQEILQGATFFRFNIPRFSNIFLMRFSEFYFGLKAFSKAKSQRPSITHAHTVFSALPFAIFRKFLPGKFVYTSHNPAWTVEKNNFLNSVILRLEGYVIKRTDACTTVSNTMRVGILEKTGEKPSKVKVVYNFVDRSKFRPLGRKWAKKNKIDGRMVLFVGKLIENKGVSDFIKCAAVLKDMKDCKFVVAGPMSFEYSAKNTWKDMVKGMGLANVIFTGAIGEKDLPSVYSSADVFLFPTKKEAFGMVLIEAMACGTPVVTRRLPVTEEIVGDSGMLETSVEGFSDAVKTILEKPSIKNKFSKKSLSRAAKFDIKIVMESYRKFYEETV